MKITKRQLRRIIKEEKRTVLKEYFGERIETGSDVIEFAQAYCGLGTAVQGQVDRVVAAYYNEGGPGHPRFEDIVAEQNPNAIDLAVERLPRFTDIEEIQEVIDALDEAQAVFMRGDAEVERDRAAAAEDNEA